MARLTSLLLLGALGVSAQPHGHGHAHLHQKQRDVKNQERDIGDIVVAVIDGDTVSWTQTENYYEAAATLVVAADVAATTAASVSATATSTYAATTPATSSSAAAATATASSSSSSSYTSFADYCSTYSSTKKRATYAQITQEGNVGDPYNCNMMLITEDLASEYNNTAKFYGATEAMTCAYWNKMSSSGGLNGWYKSEDSYQTFDLAADGVQYIAFDEGSQGGASCFPASSGLSWDSYGGLVGTWTEWDFNDVSTGWSGADASSIQAEAAGTTIYGLQVCNADDTSAECSTISSGGSVVTNAFDYSLKAADGLGLNQEGNLKITINLGY